VSNEENRYEISIMLFKTNVLLAIDIYEINKNKKIKGRETKKKNTNFQRRSPCVLFFPPSMHNLLPLPSAASSPSLLLLLLSLSLSLPSRSQTTVVPPPPPPPPQQQH
jgi:hypothetical protein